MMTAQTPLGELCRLITDGKHGDCENQPDSGFYFLSAKDVRDGKLNYEDARQITESDFLDTHRRTQLEPDDLVISNSGTIGRMALVKNQPETSRTTFQKSVAILKPKHEEVLASWLYYFLAFDLERLISFAGGTAQKNLLLRDLRAFSIALQPLPMQRKIASILSAYDDLIENNTRRIAILESMAQAIYREWFVEFRFPGHEKFKLVNSPLGKIPEKWKVVKVEDAVFINPRTAVPRDGEKPFVSMGAVPHNTMLIDVAEVEMRAGNSGSKFKNGDTLFARITPCLENGKTAFVKFLPSDEDVAFGSTEFIVLRSRTLCPEFVYLLARSDPFRDNAIKSMSGATGRQRVQEKCFDKFLLAQPDATTLGKFASQMQPLFANVFTLAKKNANLRITRDLLLPKLFSGQLNVEDLDIEIGEPMAGVDA